MQNLESNTPEYWAILRQARAKSWFYRHLVFSLMVNLLCIANYLVISLIAGGWLYFWLPWATGGLGALLLCHYLAVFVLNENLRLTLVGRELCKQGLLPAGPSASSHSKEGGSYSAEYFRAYQRADARVQARIGFYWHALIWAILNGLCWISYTITSLELGSWYYPWPWWSLLLLSLFLAYHRIWIALFHRTKLI